MRPFLRSLAILAVLAFTFIAGICTATLTFAIFPDVFPDIVQSQASQPPRLLYAIATGRAE